MRNQNRSHSIGVYGFASTCSSNSRSIASPFELLLTREREALAQVAVLVTPALLEPGVCERRLAFRANESCVLRHVPNK
jgi:hypothetical protein